MEQEDGRDTPSSSQKTTGTGEEGTGGRVSSQNNAPRHVPSTSKESPVVARRKITRPPRLESVSESEISSSNVESPSSSSEFGVRSYLHNFYEPDSDAKNKGEFYVGDHHERSRLHDACADVCSQSWWRRRCSWVAFWWKAGVFVGINILILAVLALLIGYLVKPKAEVVDFRANVAVIDQDNAVFNRKLAAAKLAGLIMLCVGGFMVAVSLLVPSLVPASDSAVSPGEMHVDPDGHFPPYMPLKNDDDPMMDDGIPYTSQLTNVQPERSGGESIVAGQGMVKVQAS